MRRRHLVQVCGEDFDASEENRGRLWRLLLDRVEFDRLVDDAPLDLDRPATLMPVDPARTRERTETFPSETTKSSQRQPKAVDELIGLAGEILVFEMLRRRYGSDVVTASSWISLNSRYVFEDNPADDRVGCDFAFTAGGRSYKVEVKASAGDEPTFTLGSSEIALAMELATRRKGRRARFILVHVKKALSGTPEPVVLPNPYGPTGTIDIRIAQGDARVRYRTRT